MVKIKYSKHLTLRLKIRKIPFNYPEEIYKNPERRFIDKIEGKLIAIKKLLYNKKLRNMMIAYEEKNGEVEIITIHPIDNEKIINRIINGRWIENG